MKSYISTGYQGYNSTTYNYGNRIISNTKIINASYTTSESVRFTFGSGSASAMEITWFEYNIFSNGTNWTWWGDRGIYIDTAGNVSGRFGDTVRFQTGSNNGVGYFSLSGNTLIWYSRTFGVSQNISSVYFAVAYSNWSQVTITYS